MSIPTFIKRVAVQTAVYWANPVPDGYGGFTYDNPVEIPCRWEYKGRLLSTIQNGDVNTTHSDVLLTQEVKLGEYLYLGSLDDFESGVDTSNPVLIEGAFRIYAVEQTPLFRSTTQFINIAFLKVNRTI